MSSNPYELRYSIISDARDVYMNQYHSRVENERLAAQQEGRPVKEIPLPSFEEIQALAQKYYDFVKCKD